MSESPKRLCIATAVLLGLLGPAKAADLPSPYTVEMQTDSGWKFSAAPYLWLSGLDGNVGIFGLPPVKVNMNFGDILKNLDFGFMGVAEARKGRFGVMTDLIYAKLSDSKNVSAGPGITAHLTASTLYWTGMGEYRLVDQDRMSVDALAGFRLYDVNNKLKLSGRRVATGNDGDTWADPMIGAKMRVNLNSNFYLTSWGMVGGFGVASNIAWDVFGGVGYSFNKTASMVAGYRALAVDYKHKGFVFDVVQHGPTIGAVFHF